MNVQVVTTAAELSALEPCWAAMAAGRPFLSPAWMAAWWRHYGASTADLSRQKNADLSIVTVTDRAERVVAIAPWYLEASLLHGRVLRFLGSGDVCTEYPSLLCRPDAEAEAVEALADWLSGDSPRPCAAPMRQVWDQLHLTGLDVADRPLQGLCEALAARGAFVHERPAARCWRLELPPDWESYLALLSKSHRKRVRRLERAYFDTGRARCRIVRSPDELEHGFRVFADLHARRWAERGDHGIFRRPEAQDFYREAAQRLSARGELRLSWLELDGRPVAAEYSLQGNQTIYAYQAGMDPAAAEHEPGSLSLIATLKNAMAEGVAVVDFLRGDEPYKQHWRAEPHPTREVRIVSDRLPCRLRHNFWRASVQVKGWLKKGRRAVMRPAAT